MQMGSREPSIPVQSHVPGVLACLEGSKRALDSESTSLSSIACSDAEDTGTLAAITRGEDPEPVPHVQQYFIGHYSQSPFESEGSKSFGPDSPPSRQRTTVTSNAFHDCPVLSSNLDAILELPKSLLANQTDLETRNRWWTTQKASY